MIYAAWHLGERTLYDTFDTSRMTQQQHACTGADLHTGERCTL